MTGDLVLRPDVNGLLESLREFQTLKAKALDKNDTILISGKSYVKRSGWRKIQLAFNISTAIVSVERAGEAEGRLVVRVKARATAPNGRVAEELGVCDYTEFQRGRLEGTLHNVESKAATRAINRAISDLVGGGEISAEEVLKGPDEKPAEPGNASPAPVPGTKYTLVAWKVKGESRAVPTESRPAGFLKKTLERIESSHLGAAIVPFEVDGGIQELRISGLDQDEVRKDIVGPLHWAVEKALEVSKEDVEVTLEEKTA